MKADPLLSLQVEIGKLNDKIEVISKHRDLLRVKIDKIDNAIKNLNSAVDSAYMKKNKSASFKFTSIIPKYFPTNDDDILSFYHFKINSDDFLINSSKDFDRFIHSSKNYLQEWHWLKLNFADELSKTEKKLDLENDKRRRLLDMLDDYLWNDIKPIGLPEFKLPSEPPSKEISQTYYNEAEEEFKKEVEIDILNGKIAFQQKSDPNMARYIAKIINDKYYFLRSKYPDKYESKTTFLKMIYPFLKHDIPDWSLDKFISSAKNIKA